MGNNVTLPDDEFKKSYENFNQNEATMRKIIKKLISQAEILKLESYNEEYKIIKILDNKMKINFDLMEKDYLTSKTQNINTKLLELKKTRLSEIKKRYLTLIEEYMQLPLKIFSTLKLSIQ